MIKSSRYVRPERPTSGFVLQARDREILRAVHFHRYLTSDHIAGLVFSDVAKRIVQTRLRKLWEHGFLDRYFAPIVLAGIRTSRAQASRPLYTLSLKGAEVIACEIGVETEHIPHTPAANSAGYATLEHNLIVTDFLVSLEAACRGRSDVSVVSLERETALRRKVAARRWETGSRTRILVPDAAVTLTFPPSLRPVTFYLEVVRALVKGGNSSLARRLEEYLELMRHQIFEKVYGHAHVRAVLIATSSALRVTRFRRLADELVSGASKFWIAPYDEEVVGKFRSTFTKESILRPIWIGPKNAPRAILPRYLTY